MKRYRLIIVGVLVLAALVGYHFFSASMKGGGMPMGGGGAMPVGVAQVSSQSVNPTSQFSGRFSALSNAEIKPQVSGTIEKILFQEGDVVKQGQPLFIIDQRSIRAGLLQAQAAFAEAEANFNRGKTLFEEDAISKRELEARTAAYQRASAALTTARLNMEYSTVKSPISGRIGRAEITVGNVVNAGLQAPTLTTIQSISPLYVDFNIDEQTYLQFMDAYHKNEQPKVRIALANNAPQEFPLEGELKFTDNQLNPATGSLRARAVVANPSGTLIPGLFARVQVSSPQAIDAVLVNDAAVGTDQTKRFVYVVSADNKAMYREVHLGGMANGLRIVVNGLNAGEKVVVTGLMRLHPGAEIAPQEVDMKMLKPLSESTVQKENNGQ